MKKPTQERSLLSASMGGKAKPKLAGQKRHSAKAQQAVEEVQPEEEAAAGCTAPLTPDPRYYRSTTQTPAGLGMARLVGFTEEQWNDLVPLLQQQGFRPY